MSQRAEECSSRSSIVGCRPSEPTVKFWEGCEYQEHSLCASYESTLSDVGR